MSSRHDGVVIVDVETNVDLAGCPGRGVVATGRGRRVQLLHDAPCFGRPVRVPWRKRIWRCGEPACPRTTWTEVHPYAASRAKLTSRAVEWAVDALRHADTTVSAIADSRLVVYPGIGHGLHWDAPERFATDLAAFTENIVGQGRSWRCASPALPRRVAGDHRF